MNPESFRYGSSDLHGYWGGVVVVGVIDINYDECLKKIQLDGCDILKWRTLKFALLTEKVHYQLVEITRKYKKKCPAGF